LADAEFGLPEDAIDRPPLAEEPFDPAALVTAICAVAAIEAVSEWLVEPRMIAGGPERPTTSAGRTDPAPPHAVGVNPASSARGSSCSSVDVWTCGRVDVWSGSGIASIGSC
jgi:hypothetical protein